MSKKKEAKSPKATARSGKAGLKEKKVKEKKVKEKKAKDKKVKEKPKRQQVAIKSSETGIDKEEFGRRETSSKAKKSLFLRFSIKDQVYFAKRLSFLIHANVPVLDSLRILRRQTKSKNRISMFDQIIIDVSSGQFLANSLGKFNKVFGDFAINIIRTGEKSGTLDENLNYLAEELAKKQKLRRKVFGALIYPALIIVATLGITAMLMIYIFPKILPIFESLDAQLPFTTLALIWLSNFLIAWGLWIIGVTIVTIVTLVALVRFKEQAHYLWDRFVLRIPLLGKISLNYQMANICRTLGLLLKSDMGPVDAFKVAASTTNNIVYRRQLNAMSDSIVKGEPISEQFAKHPEIFPDLMAQMIAIGERTGRLTDTFMYLSKLYEEEVEELTANLASAIEPLLMILMGAVVGFIAVSIITPIYEITQNLNP